MFRPGTTWIRAISPATIDAELGRQFAVLPAGWQASFAPFAMLLAPLVAMSFLLPIPALIVLQLVEAALLLRLAAKTDPLYFALPRIALHHRVMMPFAAFVSIWGLALALLGRGSVFSSIAAPTVLLLMLCLTPAYRLSIGRTARILPLPVLYVPAALLAPIAYLLPEVMQWK